MSVDIAWFPDYGYIVAGIFYIGYAEKGNIGSMNELEIC